jgi:hypothetical protein
MNTKIKEKIIIMIIAILVAFIGFNLMVSPSAVDLIKQNQTPNYEITYSSALSYVT